MRAFQCDNCEALVEGAPQVFVDALAGEQARAYRIVVNYLYHSMEPELCDNCLLEVMGEALLACRSTEVDEESIPALAGPGKYVELKED